MQTAQYGSLREKIAAETLERKADYARFEFICEHAHKAGMKAHAESAPAPMVVQDGRTGREWFVADGVCGFAWVHVPDGKSRFARWLVKTGKAHKSYRGGVDIWVSTPDQSMQRKEAYARAYAAELKAAGLEGYAQSRMD